ncbi:hypothetical protein MMA231_04030 (plasmid) [Asticcacaulis sp. MM231]|uniref:hypothetical protein n=1 Tax=Asticcacaulis sp. MM231 TaxID=3157666 RepID=UPI0032D576CE
MNDLNIQERVRFKPFTRVVNAPPAWPWDQTRVARLEAEHTSPVSGDDITIVVRRLKPWAFGETGKFVAIYLRAVEMRDGLKFELDIQGQRIAIDMPSPQQRSDQNKSQMWILGSGLVMAISLLAMGTLTLQRRAAEEDRLSTLEAKMTRAVREATGIQKARLDAAALEELDLRHRSMSQALSELKTLSLKRDPASRIEAFYWNKGYWAVEARGKDSPVKDATVPLQRSTKPVRKDVWLWVAPGQDGQP